MKTLKTLVSTLAGFSLTVNASIMNATPEIKYDSYTYLYCYGTASVNIDGENYPVTGKSAEERLIPKNFFLNKWAIESGNYVKLQVNIPKTSYFRNNANVPYLIDDGKYKELHEQCQKTLEEIAKQKIKQSFNNNALTPQISNIEIRGRDYKMSYDHQLVAVKKENDSEAIDTIVSFGDSLSDTGNTNNYFQWKIPSRTSWYAGHFTNGWTWPEYAAKELGVNAHNEAWGAAGVTDELFDQTIIGTLTDWTLWGADKIIPIAGNMNSTLYENENKLRMNNFTRIPGLYTQGEYFYEKILSRYSLNADRTLYTVLIGGNDFMNYNRDIYHVYSEVKKFVEKLIEYGAKNIAVLNLPDISIAPRFSLTNQIEAKSKMKFNAEIYDMALNQLLRRELDEDFNVNLEAKGVKIRLFDTAGLIKSIVDNAEANKLDNVTNSCLKDVLNTSYIGEKKMDPKCNGSNYFFWDNVHPTTHIHQILGKKFATFARNNYKFAEK